MQAGKQIHRMVLKLSKLSILLGVVVHGNFFLTAVSHTKLVAPHHQYCSIYVYVIYTP